jgi:ComF family protein
LSIKNKISFISNSFIDIIYPNDCVICKTHLLHNENYLCLTCRFDLPYINHSQQTKDGLQKLFWGRVDVENVYALLNYQKGNQTQKILHLLKYKDKTKLAEYFGEKLGYTIKNSDLFDFLVPVPLHPKKFKIRGYNQSTIISKGVNKVLNTDINENVLVRKSFNKSQTNFSKFDRWGNVNSIFKVINSKPFINKHVLLIDDVLTTGATIEACVKELLKIQGCRVSIATLAARI